jgi:hypothetical protein
MIIYVADMHAHVQGLVSVVNMTSMREECDTKEQRSVVRFCGQNDSMQRIFIRNFSCLWWEVFVA